MFDDGVFVYLIEPSQQTHPIDTAARPHFLHRAVNLHWNSDPDVSAVQAAEDAGVEEEEEGEEGDAADILSELDDLSWLKHRKKRAMPHNIFEEIKYLEVMIVSDHSMIFKEHLHTRVVLVAVEIWTDKDQIPISVKPLEMLRDFSNAPLLLWLEKSFS
ncbi:hypothetical protein CRUP_002610 [Coryphaenoides rupestris]|nr:hypothetical protein CRUP_002610 [Coryphaenoides rupestris]